MTIELKPSAIGATAANVGRTPSSARDPLVALLRHPGSTDLRALL